MGVKSHTTQEIVWEAWDYRLDEARKRAAWTAELEQINKDTANVDEEIRDCQAILAIASVSPTAPATPEEEKLLLSQTFSDFRSRLTVLVYEHSDLFNQDGEGGAAGKLIRGLRKKQLEGTLQDCTGVVFCIFFCFTICVPSRRTLSEMCLDDPQTTSTQVGWCQKNLFQSNS